MVQNEQRYTKVAIYLHWIIALLMIFMVFFGEDYIRVPKDGAAGSATSGPSLHASAGVAILVLSLVRLIWRLTHQTPALPPGMPAWQVTLDKIMVGLFYILMIGLPITGLLAFGTYAAERTAAAGATLFGLLPVPMFTGISTGGIHELGSNVAMGLIILHIAAALKHQFIDKDNLLKRMSPH